VSKETEPASCSADADQLGAVDQQKQNEQQLNSELLILVS
jgi:hypothetical protein